MLNIFHLSRIYIAIIRWTECIGRVISYMRIMRAKWEAPRNSTMQKQSRKKYDDAVRKR